MIQVFEYAKELYEQEVYEEAVYFLTQYLGYDKEPPDKRLEAYRMRYLAAYRLGKLLQSIQYCFEAFEHFLPDNTDYEFISMVYFEVGKIEEAKFWKSLIH